MLLLEAVLLADLGLEQSPLRLVLGFYDDTRVSGLAIFHLWAHDALVSDDYGLWRATARFLSWGVGGCPLRTVTTYAHESCGAEAGAPVEPVIVAQLVNLDALPIRRLMRHGLCHHQRFRAPLRRGEATVADEQVRAEVQIQVRLLQQQVGVAMSRGDDGERRHLFRRGWEATTTTARRRRGVARDGGTKDDVGARNRASDLRRWASERSRWAARTGVRSSMTSEGSEGGRRSRSIRPR